MQDASACCHPLHIARSDHAALARGISVCNFTLVHNADCFESAVRMLTHTARFCSRCKLRRARIVQQKKWAELFTQALVIKQRTHGETITHPMHVGIAVNSAYCFHMCV